MFNGWKSRNGPQANVNHLSNAHNDYNDTSYSPAVTFYFGCATLIIMMNANGVHKKFMAEDGSMSLMDSRTAHAVRRLDGEEEGPSSIDGHGRHMENRCLLVFMATR